MLNKLKKIKKSTKEGIACFALAIGFLVLGHCSVEDAKNNSRYQKHLSNFKNKYGIESISPELENGIIKGYENSKQILKNVQNIKSENVEKEIMDNMDKIIPNINGIVENLIAQNDLTPSPIPTVSPNQTASPSPTNQPIGPVEPPVIPKPPITPNPTPTSTPSPTVKPTSAPSSTPSPTVKPTSTPVHKHVSDDKTHYGMINGVFCEYNICLGCGKPMNIKEHVHQHGPWTFNKKTGLEERICSCGDVETREHQHKTDGVIHYGYVKGVYSEYNICSVCGKKINVKKHVHQHGPWTFNKKTGLEERECSCGNVETRKHQHKTDGIIHYGYVKGVYSEYNICSVCGEKINVKNHAHKWGSWQINPNNPNEEIRYCDCGEYEIRQYKPPIHQHVSDDKTHYGMINGVFCEYNICLGCGQPMNIKEHVHKFTEWMINPNNPNEEIRYCHCGKFETRPYNPVHQHESDGIIHYDTVNGKIIEYNGCKGCDERLNVRDHNHNYQMTSTIDHEHLACACGSNYNQKHNWDAGTPSGNKIIYACENDGCGQTKEEELVCQHTNVRKDWQNVGSATVCWRYVVSCNECGIQLDNEDHGHDPNSFVVNESATGRTEDCLDCGYHNTVIYSEQELTADDLAMMNNAELFDKFLESEELQLKLTLTPKNKSNGGK